MVMFSPYDEVREFYKKHPEFFGRSAEILVTYICCRYRQGHDLHDREPTLEEAYHHIFEEGCDWCKKELEIIIELNRKFEEGRVEGY